SPEVIQDLSSPSWLPRVRHSPCRGRSVCRAHLLGERDKRSLPYKFLCGGSHQISTTAEIEFNPRTGSESRRPAVLRSAAAAGGAVRLPCPRSAIEVAMGGVATD